MRRRAELFERIEGGREMMIEVRFGAVEVEGGGKGCEEGSIVE